MVEIIAPLFNFAIVVFILWKFGRQPFREFLSTRSKNIATQIQEAEFQSAEAKKLLGVAEKNWKSCETKACQFQEEAVAIVQRYREQTVLAARAEAERIQRESKMVAQSEMLKAKDTLQREIAQRSVRMAGQYLLAHLAEKDKQKLVSDYVELLSHGAPG
jgi:F-type H+-transporting ATPase subunit b